MHQTEAEGQKPVSGIMQLVKMQKGILSGKRHNAKRHNAKRHYANRHNRKRHNANRHNAKWHNANRHNTKGITQKGITRKGTKQIGITRKAITQIETSCVLWGQIFSALKRTSINCSSRKETITFETIFFLT